MLFVPYACIKCHITLAYPHVCISHCQQCHWFALMTKEKVKANTKKQKRNSTQKKSKAKKKSKGKVLQDKTESAPPESAHKRKKPENDNTSDVRYVWQLAACLKA